MLKYLLEKEFKQFMRNPFLPKMVVLYPIVMLLIMPIAANLEVRHINLAVVDSDHSAFSSRLVRKIASSGYFTMTLFSDGYTNAIESIDSNASDIVLEIPSGFERNFVREKSADVMVAANAVNASTGGLGSSYLSAIVADFSAEIRSEFGGQAGVFAAPSYEVVPRYSFNPLLEYPVFMVPAILVILLAMLCGFLPALNIVIEKEKGTIDQMNVTPVHRFTLIVAKLIPYWVVGFVVLTVAMVIARIVYGLSPAGSLATIYLFSGIFILSISGLGLVISNYAKTIQQAMYMIFFFVLTMIFISGLFTPVTSMPSWARSLSVFSPLKYLIEVFRMVFLKGSDIRDLRSYLVALVAFAVFFNGWAVLSYKKMN